MNTLAASITLSDLSAIAAYLIALSETFQNGGTATATLLQTFGWILQTVLRPVHTQGLVVLPKRWIVERTFAWIARFRRHCKDYEKTTASSETMIDIATINLMSRRLANQ